MIPARARYSGYRFPAQAGARSDEPRSSKIDHIEAEIAGSIHARAEACLAKGVSSGTSRGPQSRSDDPGPCQPNARARVLRLQPVGEALPEHASGSVREGQCIAPGQLVLSDPQNQFRSVWWNRRISSD